MATALGIRTASGRALHFSEIQPRPRGRSRRRQETASPDVSYEERVYASGAVATRAHSWHDFFNALVWFTFPKTKAALNSRHLTAQQQQQQPSTPGRRSREQDFLTMFDEGGIVLIAAAPDDPAHRPHADSDSLCLAFGHALYEEAILGKFDSRGLTATVHVSSEELQKPLANLTAAVDAALAAAAFGGLFCHGESLSRRAVRDLL